MQTLRLFVVDDSIVQCQHAVDLCNQAPCAVEVRSAHDGAEALAELRKESCDIVLVDLEMPVLDGVELIGYIANECLSKAIIIMSAKDISLISSVGVMAEAENLDVLGTLQKPVSQQALNSCLEKFQAESQARDDTSTESFKLSAQDLISAITRKEFFLCYQPVLSVEGLKMIGVEALCRWNHPEHGIVLPGRFISVAENAGYMGALTLELFDQALQQKKYWNDRGLKLALSLNLSPSLLNNTDFTDWICGHINYYKVDANEINFEVTESMIIGDIAKAIQILARLRLKGFHISIDDYGSGFANAEQLSRLPATELKLDRSLVHHSNKKEQQQKVLASTVQMASSLRMTTVAEGVEDIEDLALIRSLGVDRVQGFLLARPMPAEEIASWVTETLPVLRQNFL